MIGPRRTFDLVNANKGSCSSARRLPPAASPARMPERDSCCCSRKVAIGASIVFGIVVLIVVVVYVTKRAELNKAYAECQKDPPQSNDGDPCWSDVQLWDIAMGLVVGGFGLCFLVSLACLSNACCPEQTESQTKASASSPATTKASARSPAIVELGAIL